VLPENPELGEALPVAFGEIANLDDPKFSSEVGEMGMWKPYEFIIQHGFGIYFLEPYDPGRLPVLFVYGISGSPQDWRTAMEKLDRQKYQAWFAYYPSGVRLDKAANGLATALLLLKQRHGFNRIAVVAHSMGGLISRGVIQRVAKQTGTNFIPEFFTVSTPWGGHEAAESAVKHLSYPVPSWRDMAPGSDYLKEILSQPLPLGTRHDLMFSFQHSGGFGLPADNDGVVGVASELYVPVQDQAASVFGLQLGHMEILNSPITLRRIETHLPP
jgi:pimeloyl-ACP methyl ester carboxylesterase